MIKKINIFYLILICAFLLFGFPSKVNALYSNTTDTYGNGQYAITKYHINIIVNEDNAFDISEEINTNFNVLKHGIIRSIPIKNTITRLDGTTSKNIAKITNIKVNSSFSKYRENNNYNIKIGSANSTVKGNQSYSISYNYNIGNDPLKDKDELYFNLIGSEWDTTISNFSFTIYMPKEFDASTLGFALGSVGSTDSSDITYSVKENVISGNCNRVVQIGEALSVRLELPEGYFKKTYGDLIKGTIIFLIPTLCLFISFLLWKKYGKNDPVIETVEFYPPNQLNSIEVAYLYNGLLKRNDVISLLIYLANKGYIKIVDTNEENELPNKNNFKIIKLKEYDGNNNDEKLFLEGLFKNYDKNSSDETKLEVTSKELKNKFYVTVNDILDDMNRQRGKEDIYITSSLNKKIYIYFMMILSFLSITILSIVDYIEPRLIIPVLIFTSISLCIVLSLIINKEHDIVTIITSIFCGFLFYFTVFLLIMLPALINNIIYFIGYAFGILCIISMSIIIKHFFKRSSYGIEMLSKIRGFKRFLETVEKDKLESLVEKNPNYFYDILPYTYVLGISKKWISKFELLGINEPNWYEGNNSFDISSINSMMTSTISSTLSSSSSYSGGSDGGSSGGGSSDGGSGGGGGSSW